MNFQWTERGQNVRNEGRVQRWTPSVKAFSGLFTKIVHHQWLQYLFWWSLKPKFWLMEFHISDFWSIAYIKISVYLYKILLFTNIEKLKLTSLWWRKPASYPRTFLYSWRRKNGIDNFLFGLTFATNERRKGIRYWI